MSFNFNLDDAQFNTLQRRIKNAKILSRLLIDLVPSREIFKDSGLNRIVKLIDEQIKEDGVSYTCWLRQQWRWS